MGNNDHGSWFSAGDHSWVWVRWSTETQQFDAERLYGNRGRATVLDNGRCCADGDKQDDVLKQTTDHLEAKLISGYDGQHTGQTGATLLIDAIQIQFDCCGIVNHEDFDKASSWSNKSYDTYSNLAYPASCCVWNKSEDKNFIEPFSFRDVDTCMKHSQGDTSANTSSLTSASNYQKPCGEALTKFAN